MKLDNNNIEELFKSQFENFEAPVNDAMWSNISQGIQSGATSTSATVGKTLLSKWVATAGIAVTTGLVGAGITFAVMSDDKEQENPVEQNTEIVQTPVQELVEEEVTPQVEPTKVEETVISRLPEDLDDPVIEQSKPIETKSEPVKEPVIYPLSNKAEYDYLMATPIAQLEKEQENRVIAETVEEIPVTQVSTEEASEESTEENTIEFLAAIDASNIGGYAPLDVSFYNLNDCKEAYWDFGDGNTSNAKNPSHLFEKYGEYKVTLTVKDEKGNVAKDEIIIMVESNSSITRIPNVFTPNNDGYNDVFRIEAENIDEYKLFILDKGQNIIFTSESVEEGWNGKDLYGNVLPVGEYLYMFVAKGIDGKKYKHEGSFFLQL